MKEIIQILLAQILLVRVIVSLTYQEQQVLIQQPVYTSFQTAQVALESICGSSNLSYILPITSTNNDIFFATSDTCGLVLFQLTKSGDFSLLKSFKEIQEVTAMRYNAQRNSLWIADRTFKVNEYDLSTPTQLVEINQIQGINQTYQINFSDDSKQLFLIKSDNQIQIYNIESQPFSMIQSFISPNNPKQIIISQNKKVMIVAAFNVYFYTILNAYNAKEAYHLTAAYISISNDDTPQMYLIDDKYLYTQSFHTGLTQYNVDTCISTGSCSDSTVIQIQTQKYLMYYFSSLMITPDNNFFVGFIDSVGIYAFDVSLRNGFPLYQAIDFVGVSSAMVLNIDGSQILLTMNKQLNQFLKIKSNLNIDAPNILNLNQNYLYDKHLGANKFTWHCYIDNNRLITNQASNGTFFFDINQINKSLQIVNHVNLNYYPAVVDESRLLINPYQFIMSYGSPGMFFFEQSNNYQDIVQISSYIPPMQNADMDSIKETKNQKYLFVASGYIGVIVVDITDVYNPKHVTAVYYTFDLMPSSSAENVVIHRDEKILYCAYRNMGIVIYDISDFTNPKQINLIYTKGGEDVVTTGDFNHLITIDGYSGLNIYTIADPANPIWVSQIVTRGWSVRVKFVQNDSFILTTSMYSGQLYLIDFRDRLNPSLMQSYQYQGIENTSADVCITPDGSTAFMISLVGIVTIPLSNSVIFHTDIIWLKDIPNISVPQMVLMTPSGSSSKNEALQVGMNVQLQLSQIYPQNIVSLKNAYYYDNQQMKPFPWWITLSQNSLSANLIISKDALNQQEIQDLVNAAVGQNSQQKQMVQKQKQIVFNLSERIASTDFQQSTIGISANLAQQIFSDCQNKQIIMESGFLNDNYSVNYVGNSLTDPAYTNIIIDHIKYVLRSKINYYPVTFSIQNSLFIDIYSHTQVIDSFSDNLSVYFTVDQDKAQFISMNYPSVLTSFTDKFGQIKIEGSLSSVNSILKTGIKLANLTSFDLIQVRMDVDDGVNYNLYKEFIGSETNIISLNKPTYVNPLLSLDQDFKNKYSFGEIAILDKFQYQLSSQIFKDDDSPNLTFEAFILSSNQTYIPIPHDSWISFDESQKTFSGTPPSSQLNDMLYLKVVSSDGYTLAEDHFSISVSIIPASVILTMIFQILGPIFGILGLWRYSSSIYNIVFKRKHETTHIMHRAGDVLEFQIPLIFDEIKIAKKLWLSYFNLEKKNDVILALCYFKQKLSQNEFIMSFKEKLITSKQNQDKCYENSEVDRSPYQMNSSQQTNQNFKSLINSSAHIIKERDGNMVTDNLSPIKLRNPSARNISTSPLKRINDKYTLNKLLKQVSQNDSKQIKKSQQITKRQTTTTENKFEKIYFNQSGHINREYIMKEVLDHYSKNNNTQVNNDILLNLQQTESKLSRCIIGLATISIAEFDDSTNKIIEYLKNQALLSYTLQDWYKLYVTIQPNFEQIQINPFPNIEVDQESILEQLKILNEQDSNQKTGTANQFYLPLIYDCIISIAYGFTYESHIFIPYPIGECLKMNAQNLKCIESYTPTTSTSFLTIRKLLDLDYVQKELIDNSKLNSWIQQVDISNNVILIRGIPKNKDTGKYLIKIKHYLGYTIKRINIEVVYNHQISSQVIQSNSNIRLESAKIPQKPLTQFKFNMNECDISTESHAFNQASIIAPVYQIETNSNSQNLQTEMPSQCNQQMDLYKQPSKDSDKYIFKNEDKVLEC